MPDRQPPDEWIEAANCLATVASTLASAVHEANNMLQVISGSAEMITMNAQLPESVYKRSAVIADHAQRVSTLLASLRDLSKYPPCRPGDATDLTSVVNAALDLRRHALNRGQVTVAFNPGESTPIVRASWRPMMQVVLNLLMNAEQAVIGRDPAWIGIEAQTGANEVELSVSDNGGGLPETTASPFVLREMDEAAPRLGLGLAAAHYVIGREGGRLDLRSTATGTTAVMRLPRSDA